MINGKNPWLLRTVLIEYRGCGNTYKRRNKTVQTFVEIIKPLHIAIPAPTPTFPTSVSKDKEAYRYTSIPQVEVQSMIFAYGVSLAETPLMIN